MQNKHAAGNDMSSPWWQRYLTLNSALLLSMICTRNECYIFAYFSQIQHLSRTWLYLWNTSETLIPTIHCLYANIVQFSRTSRIHFCAKNMPLKPMGVKNSKISLPVGALGSHLIHECISWPHSPLQTTARSVHALSHNCATKSPLVNETPKFTPKIVPFLGRPSPI